MTTEDFKRIGREAARDFANNTTYLDHELPSHKELGTQALAQVIAAHVKANFAESFDVEPSKPVHVKDSIIETPQ